MSIFLDTKYLTLISNRLPLFKKKDDTLYNCRCVICGDSQKNLKKARGFFFAHKTELRYKCHNCDASLTFRNFLKRQDTNLYQQYQLESYSEGTPLKSSDTIPSIIFEQPVFKTPQERLIDKLLVRLDKLPEDHEAVQYCKSRLIPMGGLSKIYFIENIKDIVQLNAKYKNSITTSEPRIVLPCYNASDELTGVVCRGIRNESLRYINVKIKEDEHMVFGLSDIDYKKPIYVVEGPLDSLFLDNAVAVVGTSFSKLEQIGLNKENLVLIIDNQPRNKEVVKLYSNMIEKGYRVVIWPQILQQKDINDMVLAGKDVSHIIKYNTFTGLEARTKLISWKRV